jgi:type IV secretion system protein TrbJ
LVVFDPNNYAQNVLTAARALEQFNNQITSLQNQALMLINQAKKPPGPVPGTN